MLIVLAREPKPVRGGLLQSCDHDVREDWRHIWWTSRWSYSGQNKNMAMVPSDKVLAMVRNRFRGQWDTLFDHLGLSHSRRSPQLSPQFSSRGLSQPPHLQDKEQTPRNRLSRMCFRGAISFNIPRFLESSFCVSSSSRTTWQVEIARRECWESSR
jgi:hypothetical protein